MLTWISERPTELVDELTSVTVKRRVEVMSPGDMSMGTADPLFMSVGTWYTVPSLNVSVPAQTWSFKFGLHDEVNKKGRSGASKEEK